MLDIGQIRYASSKTKAMVIGAGAIVIIGIILAIILTRGYYAKTMRLLRVEGVVRLEDAEGNEKTLLENMRFQSGQSVSTSMASLCSISLDENKIVTLQESSRAEFIKQGKMLELKLTRGGVFFDVQKPLETDETFDIRTSTMVVGIRGTSGYVFIDEEGHECLLITDGHVHVVGTNPETGEVKEIDVYAGQQITVYLYNDRDVDSIEFFLEEIEEYDLEVLPLRMLWEDPDLLAKVCRQTGWDPALILSLANGTVPATDETEASESSEETTETPSPTATSTPTTTPEPTDETDEPTATPSPTSTRRPTATPTRRPTGGGGGNGGGSGNGGGNGGGGNGGTTETEAPSEDLTPTPSAVPTVTPIVYPTYAPPTYTPTSSPSGSPTSTPSGEPTITLIPMPSTTEAPGDTDTPPVTDTPAVTGEPTTTDVPTVTPVVTEEPTSAPTGEPTNEPTGRPTDEPTGAPTDAPTDAPTEAPVNTDTPTEAPVITETPTEAPVDPTGDSGEGGSSEGGEEGGSGTGETGSDNGTGETGADGERIGDYQMINGDFPLNNFNGAAIDNG